MSAPLRLQVTSVGLDVPVAPVGVDGRGAMQLPDTVDEAAWYRFGPAPGAAEGSAVLAGHIDSFAEGIGPFVRLQHLRHGAVVTVTTTAGDRAFGVTDVRRVSKRAVPLASIFERTGPSRLILMTCAGAYDHDRGGYQDNLIVTAVPLRS